MSLRPRVKTPQLLRRPVRNEVMVIGGSQVYSAVPAEWLSAYT